MKKLSLKKKEEKFDAVSAMIIDRNNLDDEVEFQPVLMANVIQLYKKALNSSAIAELELRTLEENLTEKIKKNPVMYGWDNETGKQKLTDAALMRLFSKNEEYQNAFLYYESCKSEVKEYEWLLKACEQRSHSLKRLYTMWESGYLADPTIKKKMGEHNA